MAEAELKPCPFCDSEAVSLSYATNVENVITNRFVECEDCAACGPAYPPAEKAIAAWNSRHAPTQEQREAVAREVLTAKAMGPVRASDFCMVNGQEVLTVESAIEAVSEILALLQPQGRDHV